MTGDLNPVVVQCAYSGCDVTLPHSQMVEVFDGEWVCPSCENKMSNNSGYCSNTCQLGYGCDDSC